MYPDEPRVGVGVVCFREPHSGTNPEVRFAKPAVSSVPLYKKRHSTTHYARASPPLPDPTPPALLHPTPTPTPDQTHPPLSLHTRPPPPPPT